MVGQAVLILSTAIVLFVIGFVTVSLPLCVRMRPKLFEDYAVPISVVMDFAGGVLFAAGLVHMLPDAQENLSKYFGSDAFPWFGAIAGGVFLFMFSIEFVFHDFMKYFEEKQAEVPEEGNIQTCDDCKETSAFNAKEKGYGSTESDSPPTTDLLPHLPPCPDTQPDQPQCESIPVPCPVTKKMHKKRSFHDHDWTMIMLAIALDIHSVMAGLGLGCEDTDKFFAIFGAIVAHKGFAGFALGVTMTKTARPLAVLLFIGFIFAISTPTGMIIGWQVMSKVQGPEQILAEGLLQSMAGGTFLYVAIFSILADDSKKKMKIKHKLMHVISAALGFILMSLLALWT